MKLVQHSKYSQHCGYWWHGALASMQFIGLIGLTRSISWLLMPWLLASPGHQQPWYWLCRIHRSWSYLRKNFKYLCQINVEDKSNKHDGVVNFNLSYGHWTFSFEVVMGSKEIIPGWSPDNSEIYPAWVGMLSWHQWLVSLPMHAIQLTRHSSMTTKKRILRWNYVKNI